MAVKKAQNVMKEENWYKSFVGLAFGFVITFIIHMFLCYGYLSYIHFNSASDVLLNDLGSSLSLLFNGGAYKFGFSFNIFLSMLNIYSKTWYFQILVVLLFLLKKKQGEFKGVEHGSARWATKKDRKPFLNDVGYPLQHNLVVSPNTKGLRNYNELVIGDSGTGKTFHKLVAELMQCTGNYVVIDVKGSLYKYCAYFLKEAQYEIKILNLIERPYSNTYNPLAYCKTQDDIDQLAETFIINSRKEDGKQGDEIWENSSEMLLKSIVSYLVSNENEEKTFARVLDLVLSLKMVNGSISPFSEFEMIIADLRTTNPFHPAILNYDSLKQSATETMQGVLISLTTRLKLWTTEEVRILTMSDEMNFEDLLKEKQIIFLNIPQRTGAYKTISSLFLTQLFDTLYRLADEKYAGRLQIPINVLLDEFANCGTIPKFDNIISTCRSYNIRCVPCIQNKQQLEKLYSKAEKTIMSNCSIWNYLGTGDLDTQKLICEKLGKTTIEERNKSRNVSGNSKGGGSESDRGLGRELMKVDEINNMKKNHSIVFIGGFYPFYGEKYKTQNHKCYAQLGYDDLTNTYNTYPKEEYQELSLSHKARYYDYVSSAMDNNKSFYNTVKKAEEEDEKKGSGKTQKRKNDTKNQDIPPLEAEQEQIRAEIENMLPQEESLRDKLKNKMM